ncbi:hypothetical protein DL769_009661 [Monosporascus sp. CRB-8-3]|nr:hypothetical protein DL769_009661 [Monosporascus sp. CRB-8-3]
MCESVLAKDWESPEYRSLFRQPLPIPPMKQPKQIITNPVTGGDIWYYEIELKGFQQQVYPQLQPARLVGYDGISPGPTFIIPKGTESVVRFINNAKRENSVHLHGSPSRAPFDGWAEDVTKPGQFKDYYYRNTQSARTLWYHDHAMAITAENANFGQAGAYLLTDPAEDSLGLPSGYGQFDIPLNLASKYYNENGTLQSALGEEDSLWGDIIHVVASDAGLLEVPVGVSDLYVSVAERYEVVFDFSAYAGQTIELRNMKEVGGLGVDDDYLHTDKVMRFVVSAGAVSDPSVVPATLRAVSFPPAATGIDRSFLFERTNSEWRINGVGFADVENRILAKVPRGTVEVWELENGSGGWTHPIQVHLVDFKILQRTNGERGVMPYEARGLKDVVWLARHERVLVEAHYAPWDGVYMFHCHNLIHEDHDMTAAFNVTTLDNFGYNEITDYSDPLDPRWRARSYNRADFLARTGAFSDAAIIERVQELALQQPYSELDEVEQSLDEFWEENGDSSRFYATRSTTLVGPIPRYRRFVL